MKRIVIVLLLAAASTAFAQDQIGCAAQLDAKMKEMGALTTAQAGQATYTKLFARAKQCVENGKCGKADAFIAISEMMVEEQVISIQRKKIAALKSFFIEARPYENDPCALVERFPRLFDQIKSLNEQQLERFVQLTDKQFPGNRLGEGTR